MEPPTNAPNPLPLELDLKGNKSRIIYLEYLLLKDVGEKERERERVGAFCQPHVLLVGARCTPVLLLNCGDLA